LQFHPPSRDEKKFVKFRNSSRKKSRQGELPARAPVIYCAAEYPVRSHRRFGETCCRFLRWRQKVTPKFVVSSYQTIRESARFTVQCHAEQPSSYATLNYS